MTPTMLFLIILAAALLSNSVVLAAQMWIVRSSRRETGKFPKLHACEPPSFTDDEIEEQIISQKRVLEAIQQLEQRREEAVARLLKRGVLVRDPREDSPVVVRRSPPSAS